MAIGDKSELYELYGHPGKGQSSSGLSEQILKMKVDMQGLSIDWLKDDWITPASIAPDPNPPPYFQIGVRNQGGGPTAELIATLEGWIVNVIFEDGTTWEGVEVGEIQKAENHYGKEVVFKPYTSDDVEEDTPVNLDKIRALYIT